MPLGATKQSSGTIHVAELLLRTRSVGLDMTIPTSTVMTWRYTRWKALLFVALAAIATGLCLWLLISVPVRNQVGPGVGQSSEDFVYAWIVRPILFVGAAGFLVRGAWSAIAVWTNAEILMASPEWIQARTSFGRRRRLKWSEITDAASYGSEIILSPGEAGAKAQVQLPMQHNESAITWEWLTYRALGAGLAARRAVVINVGVLDAAPGEIRDLIARQRPDLVIRKVCWS